MSAVKRFLKVFFIMILVISLVSGVVFGTLLVKYMKDVSDIELGNMALNLTTTMYYYDKDGNPVQAQHLYGKENRMWVNFDKIPQNLKNAFIAIEDERFYQHHGVDLRRTIAATFTYLFIDKTSFGGSTITQQLVKNVTGEDKASPARKVKEMARAFKIDKELGKDKVLEMYLNIIYLANSCNGVEAASHKYFGKDVSKLTLAECAAIAGITKNPSKYDPLKKPENNKIRQKMVLDKMLELKMISKLEYDESLKETLNFKSDDLSVNETVNSYFVDHVINEVVSDLVAQKGYSKKVATNLIYMGGLKIYMTMDPTVQNAVEQVYEDKNMFPKNVPKNPSVTSEKEYPQSAMCIIDPYTGQVKGVAGGIGAKTQNRVLNRATQSIRQPGSAIKPLSVYGPALEQGLITPNSTVVDEPINIKGWKPKNYYSGFKGPITVRYAVEQSANIPAVKILQDVGLDNSYNFLTKKLGITTLVDGKEIGGKVYSDKTYPSLALGGLTTGLTPEEIASAYGAFANQGNYCKSYSYVKVLDSNGKVLLENKTTAKRAMSEKTASYMNSLLRSVVTSGTGTKAQLSGGMLTYGKTGTTNSDKDRWFVGYTPYYVGSVWYGYDHPSSVAFLRTNPCIPVWKAVMDKIHEGLAVKSLQGTDTKSTSQLERVKICTDSGLLATKDCPNVSTESFSPGEAPTKYCNLDHSKDKANETGQTPSDETPSNDNKTPSKTQDGVGNGTTNSGDSTQGDSTAPTDTSGGGTNTSPSPSASPSVSPSTSPASQPADNQADGTGGATTP